MKITPGMFLKVKSNGWMYRVIAHVETDQQGTLAVAEIGTPRGQASTEFLKSLPIDVSDADFARMFEVKTEGEWLALLGDRADRDGPTLAASKTQRCKKCGVVLPPWDGCAAIIQCEKCGAMHGAPPPQR